ncbi:terminase [Pimelobacter simplex]|uniref:Terminase n=1 Tax=Nocardioides simplex TaxID=2045 RepID=A0A7J5DVG3_NOCSI|nr:terminase [Pimelobacter simplex]KAB2809252.1 terminase [Pimelobacter simplex]
MTTATSDLLLPGYWIDEATGAWCTLPWPTDPDERMALVRSSLGPAIIDWSEGRTELPGLIHYMTGQPWRWTAGQKRFLILWYHVNEDGRFTFRSGAKRGAKGTGKDPTAGGMCNTELVGPVELYDWDEKTGRPIGRPRGFPLVQVMSNSEAQSKDVLRVANAMWSREAREFYDLDCGETRTVLRPNGGRFEIPPSSEASGEGDPATFVALNESHHMTETSGGQRVAAMARRNVGKSPAEIQARLCEFTNAHKQGGGSVAESTFEEFQKQQAPGYRGKRDLLYDSIEAPPATDILTAEGRMAGARAAYSDAPWADLERICDEMMDSRTTVADTIRFYLNGLAAEEDAWVEPTKFDDLARADVVIADGDEIAMFLDCSKSEDATGLVGCRLSDGHVFQLGVWQRPRGARGTGWLVPRAVVDSTVRAAFDRYAVSWFGVDPSPARDDEDEALYWGQLIDDWHRDFRDGLAIWATPGASGHAVKFDMRLSQRGGVERNKQFTEAAMQAAQDIDEDAALTWDGSSILRLHVHNARRRPNQWGVSLGKVTRDSSKLVDLAVCMVGARMGRQIALNSTKKPAKKRSGKVW